MVQALSVDLQKRVITAIDDGLFCGDDALWVSAASAIRWRQPTLRTGKVSPAQVGTPGSA